MFMLPGDRGGRKRPTIRGVLVTKAADQTGANYSAGSAIGFDSTSTDTDQFHSNTVNTSRLTIPAGVSLVMIVANVFITNITSSTLADFWLAKNGSDAFLPGSEQKATFASTSIGLVLAALLVPVVPGDYFEAFLQIPSDSSVSIIANKTNFALVVLQ